MSNIVTETVPWLRETNPSAATTKAPKTILDKDDFLKLLIAELKYQDPLEPMKDKEFISQMATFSSLEQMKNLNTGFEKLAANINNNLIPAFMFQQSANMVGHEVKYLDPESLEKDNPEIVTGNISSVIFKDGIAYYLINGKQIDPAYIFQVSGLGNQGDENMSKLMEKLEELLALLKPGEGESSD
ncbi:MAG: flagellar hook capping FlgD N-terminal domain-containing protein [Syntrophomonadaceae bacterium]|nr:flagellar hook capping FlgD N-terminal domain-containing protein [Syntrophomonadaceae bacterium]